MFIEMWFFIVTTKAGSIGPGADIHMMGPFQNQEQCVKAQEIVEHKGFPAIIPCYKAQ